MSILGPQLAGLAVPPAYNMRTLRWLTHLGALGLFAVAALDSSVFPLPLPGSADLFLLWLASRGESPWLLVPAAIVGSVIDGFTTWHLGQTGGRATLRRYVSAQLLEPLCGWVKAHPILSIFLFPLLPPPFPLTPFVLASGALGVTRRRFLLTYGAARSLRYSLVAWVGVTYGRHVVRLWSSALQKWSGPLFWVFVALLVAGIGFGIWKTLTQRRSISPNDPSVEDVTITAE
jgi:membrane protein YqaA with SNARE-associated domain